MADSNFEFGSNKVNLQPSTYSLPVKMMKATNITSPSMASSCIKNATITIGNDNKANVAIDLQAVSIMGISDWAENWQIYKGNSANGETFTADTHTNEENKVDQISFEIPDNAYDGVYVNLFVPAISLNTNAYLAFDYDNAVDTNTSKFYTGTAHISQFGEYDINATVEVKGGKIKGITVTGDNFKGTYATINQNMLQTAFNGLKDAFTGKDATNAEEVHNIDAVTGATYSSNGIRDAVMNALNLAIEDEVINLPTEQLKAGIYSVDIAYYSDNVAHSLIENEKAKATITVDNNGNMSLSTDVINGTVKEPLYILDFNGYYTNNDLNNSLTMEMLL